MTPPRLLADENCPAPSIRMLRDQGFDVLAIAEVQPGMTDVDVLQLACSEQRWLLTLDLDFGELAFNRQLPLPPAIVLIRASEDISALIVAALAGGHADDGGFFVLDDRGVRWRPFSPARQ
ncbi:MAG: DUF5615 family PIN-like protein [Proteobacteria bacterium]|nr:DUF5615 family PIN-like protein [Pseudomonadota bacterium]